MSVLCMEVYGYVWKNFSRQECLFKICWTSTRQDYPLDIFWLKFSKSKYSCLTRLSTNNTQKQQICAFISTWLNFNWILQLFCCRVFVFCVCTISCILHLLIYCIANVVISFCYFYKGTIKIFMFSLTRPANIINLLALSSVPKFRVDSRILYKTYKWTNTSDTGRSLNERAIRVSDRLIIYVEWSLHIFAHLRFVTFDQNTYKKRFLHAILSKNQVDNDCMKKLVLNWLKWIYEPQCTYSCVLWNQRNVFVQFFNEWNIETDIKIYDFIFFIIVVYIYVILNL